VCVDDFDYVVALDDSVYGDLRKMYPGIDARLISWNIDDPICKGIEAYERSARRIQKPLKEVSTSLIERNGAAAMS
jgi:protein-tyrosine-phosphatase